MNTLRSHLVAQKACEQINTRHKKLSEAEGLAYESLALKLPVMILQNGLAQATGFLLAKSRAAQKSEHAYLLEDLATVLTKTNVVGCCTPEELHQTVINADVNKTILLTRRALEASAALRRYVQGVMKATPPKDNNKQKDTGEDKHD